MFLQLSTNNIDKWQHVPAKLSLQTENIEYDYFVLNPYK